MFHHLLAVWVPEIAGFIEFIGILIILFGFVKCGFQYVGSIAKKCDYNLTICLGHSFTTGLQIMMGAEIMKSVLVPTIDDLLLLLGIVVIRIALTILLHYEIKNQEAHGSNRRC